MKPIIGTFPDTYFLIMIYPKFSGSNAELNYLTSKRGALNRRPNAIPKFQLRAGDDR